MRLSRLFWQSESPRKGNDRSRMFGHEGAVLDEPRLLSAKGGIATAVSISASLRTGMATGSMPSDTAAASNEARKGVNGEAAGGTCLGCHGYDAKGSPQ